MPEVNKIIGSRVAKLRKQQKLTQREVAKVLGLEAPAVSKIETGKRKLTVEELIKLSKYMRVKPEVFYGGIIKPRAESLGYVIKNDSSIYTKAEWEAVKALLALPVETREELARSFKSLAKAKAIVR